MERSRIRRSVTSGIKLKPLSNYDGCMNSRKMERATSVEEIDLGRTRAKARPPPLPFPLIRNQNPLTNKRSSSSAQGTSGTYRSVDASQPSVDRLRNLPHLDLEDRENRSSAAKTTSNNDRGQTFPTILVNQQTTISTSEVLDDLSLSSSAFSDVLHQFRDDRQLTITTSIAPVRGRQARRCTSQSSGWQPVVTISHSRVLRIIPPIAYPPEHDDEDLNGEQQQEEARSSSQSVIKEGNGSKKTTTSSNGGRVPYEPTYLSSPADSTPRNQEIAEVMEYINNFDISSSGTSTPKTTFSIRCTSDHTTIESSSLVDGYAPSAVTKDLRPTTQNMGEKLKTMSVGERQDAIRQKLDELKGRQRYPGGEWNKQKTGIRRVRHNARTTRLVGGDGRHETTVTGGVCRGGRRIGKRRVHCPARLPKTTKYHPSPDKMSMKESFMLKDKYLQKGLFMADGRTSGGDRYDIEVREEPAAVPPWKSTSPSVNAQRQNRAIHKNSNDSVAPVQTTGTGGSDGGSGRASHRTLLETEDSGLDTDPRTDFLDRMMRMSVEDTSPSIATNDARMEDQLDTKQAPEVGVGSENKTDREVAMDDGRGAGAASSSDYRYESKTAAGRRSDGSARELCLLTDSKSSTPAFLEPSQDLDNFSTSSSPIGDELASLPGSPFYRQVLQRRSSSIDSSFSRPGSDFLEVPLLAIQAKDRSPGGCLLDETLTESPPDNSPVNEDPLHGGDLQQQIVHRLSDSVQLPPVTPCQSPVEGVASDETESRQEPGGGGGGGIIWKPTMEVSAAAPQVSLTTEDGDDFAVWFGRRGSIFIEEKGAPPRGQQHQLSLLSLTTRNEQGQVSLAVPKSNNN